MDKLLKTWLDRVCRILPGSKYAEVLTGTPDEGPYSLVLSWPENEPRREILARITQAALRSKQAVIKTRNNAIEETGEPRDALACPLFLNGQLLGVVAIEMTNRSQPMQQAAVQQVQYAAKWLETMVHMHGATAKEQLVDLVELVAAGLEHEHFKVAATDVVTELANRFSCQRVSVGFMRFNRLQVEAMSHSTQLDKQSNLVRSIRDAMCEGMDQKTTVVYPLVDGESVFVTRFHDQLAKRQNGVAICTLPLVKDGKAIGALLLERAADEPFSRENVEQIKQIGLLLGPVLETRRREERSIFIKAPDAFQGWLRKLFGPRHLVLKTSVIFGAALLFWLSVADDRFRIATDSVLEARVCRAIVAPQEGYIAATHVRAGDLVREGDILAALDTKELLQEQRKWQSQRAQLLKEYRKALASSNRSEVAILKAKRLQAEAQLNLVDQQLLRTTLVAPFNGLVVKGDLSQALGSPVERGEILFEVAPIDEYRVVLKVDDRDVGLISKGQVGTLRLSSIPDQLVNIKIDRLTPVSTTEEGRNYFRVEAVMAEQSDLLRPGMEGIAKIDIGEEKMLWIWTRRMVEWLRLSAWGWLP